MNWQEIKVGYRWERSDGAVVKWDCNSPHPNPAQPTARMWTAWEPDPSERYLGMKRGHTRRLTNGTLSRLSCPRRWKTAEAAMKAVDRECPVKEVQLDPDFRREPKADKYCVRCQKDIADEADAIKVTVNWDTWMVRRGGKELLGKNCAKLIGL